jgi:hypothetical protein
MLIALLLVNLAQLSVASSTRRMLKYKEEIISVELDALTQEVNDSITVEASAIVLITGLSAQITAAGTDPAKLSALTAQLDAGKQQLAAAIVANTPAAPAPVVAPAPTT